MKKLVFFLIPLIVSIPAFAQDKSLFTENFSLVKYSGNFNLNTASSVNNLFHTEEECQYKQYLAFQTPKFHTSSELIYFSMDSVIERKEQNSEKPPLSKKRIVNEILAGGGLGVVGGLAVGLAGAGIGSLLAGDDEEDIGLIAGFFIGASIGYSIGSAFGVYIVGDTGDETGSFIATLGGGLLGGALSCAVILSRILPGKPLLDYVFFFAAPPILACIGFNMTRRYKSSPSSESGLLNFREGQINLGIPMVYFQSDPFAKRALAMNVNLISVEF